MGQYRFLQSNLYRSADGETFSYIYDEIGRVIRIDRPDTRSVWFAYDDNGNMSVLSTPSLVDHVFDYNTVNLNSGYTTPLSGVYTYDRDRRLVRTDFPSGGHDRRRCHLLSRLRSSRFLANYC